MDSMGRTSWEMVTPRSTLRDQGSGSCFSATRRMFRSAWRTARTEIRQLTCLRAALISLLRDPNAAAAEVDAIQFFAQAKSAASPRLRTSAMILRGDALGFAVALVASAEEIFFDGGSEFEDAHQSTILFKGYSTMP